MAKKAWVFAPRRGQGKRIRDECVKRARAIYYQCKSTGGSTWPKAATYISYKPSHARYLPVIYLESQQKMPLTPNTSLVRYQRATRSLNAFSLDDATSAAGTTASAISKGPIETACNSAGGFGSACSSCSDTELAACTVSDDLSE